MIIHETGQYQLTVREPLDLTIIQLKGEDIQVDITLDQPDTQANIHTITIGQNDEKANLTINILHRAPRTTATFNGRALLQESSHLTFRGLIKIEDAAPHTESHLTHRSLIQDQAGVSPIPSLEIENNEVVATHAAAVTKLDADALFYLRSRGLSEEEATNLLTTAFLADVTDHLEPQWQQTIANIIH